jgi:hypothetical protein
MRIAYSSGGLFNKAGIKRDSRCAGFLVWQVVAVF